MGKKIKKRSNKSPKKNKPPPRPTSPRNAEEVDVVAAAAASNDNISNPPRITLLDSPEKVEGTAVAELPVVAEVELPQVGNNVLIFDAPSVEIVDTSCSDQTVPLMAVEDNGCAQQLCKSTTVSESKDDAAAAAANFANVLEKKSSTEETLVTPIVVDDEKIIPNGGDDDDKEDVSMQQSRTVKENDAANDLVVEEAVVKNTAEEVTTIMVDQVIEAVTDAASSLATNDPLVPDDAAAAVLLPAMKKIVVEETAPTVVVAAAAEEETASSLVDSVQETVYSVARTEAKQETSALAWSQETPVEPEAVKEDSASSSVKENAMDAVPVAIETEHNITTTNANGSSSTQAISCPTPVSTKSNDNNFESMIETPSPSKVADLKSKLWDSKGLQVRIRPSLTAADILQRKHSSAPLAPVPSPYKPTAAPSGGVSSKAEAEAAAVPSTIASATNVTAAAAAAAAAGNKDIKSAHAVSQTSQVTAPSAPLSSHIDSPATSSSATGLSANNNGRRLGRRKGPTAPKSILDEKALLAALQERGVAMKDIHISAFYQALHRQQYPDLPTFVENFYKHESNKHQHEELLPTVTGPAAQTAALSLYKNKNRNKMQLPKAFLEFLSDPQNGFSTMTSKIVEAQTSSDKSTTKLAIELQDGKMIESVLMRYNKNSQENHRASLCISSQCGCAMGCTFCATGMMGLSGNLTTAEILEQIIHADGILAREWSEQQQGKQQQQQQQQQTEEQHQQASELRTKKQTQKKPSLDAVRNVVFMGMGEPLDNYTNVVEACRTLMDRKRWNLAHGRVTVSTVGLVSQMRKISQDLPHVNLALSLHAPTQELRVKIVPSAKRYPIEELVDALDGHMQAYLNSPERRLHSNRQRHSVNSKANDDGNDDDGDDMSRDGNPESTNVDSNSKENSNTRRRAMIEYIMLVGETSTETSAHELGKLCQGKSFVVNLIPYNATNVKDPLKCPTYDEMQKFRAIVASYGVFCTVRRTMGSDIDSACGQLITLQQQQQQQKQQHDQGTVANGNVVRDIEDASRSCQPRSSPKAGNDASTSMSQKTTTTTRVNANNKDDGDNNKDDFDKYIGPLAIAAGVVATCFFASIFFRRRR